MEDVLCDVALFRELAMEEGCYGIPRAFADRFTRLRYFRGEDVHVDTAYHREQGSRVTLMSGLPASGKDTWIESHRRGLPVVGFDDAREELGLRHGKNDGLAAHRDFVFIATHLSRQRRERSIDLLLSYGAEVEVAYLEQAEAELLRRNSRRDSTLPNAAIGRMLHRWEVVLPTEAHSVLYLPTQRTRQR
jgi:predicted kinase